ncbi:MAG: DUF2892 domain-containing protein [Chitinophagales bacterium]
MAKNLGSVDRAVRVLIGIVAVAIGLTQPIAPVLVYILILFGVVEIATSALAY